MGDRITDAELSKIVAAVERVAQSREAELDRQQVMDILDQLGLPAELLDDALVQLRRQEALAARRRWQRRGSVLGVVAIAALLAATLFWQRQRQQALAALATVQDQVMDSQDRAVAQIDPQTSPQLKYQVTLEAAPVGRRLNLACDWSNPSGKIVHQNSYQTQPIQTPVWQTWCRYQLGTTAEPGTWTVEMRLGNRALSQASFEVE